MTLIQFIGSSVVAALVSGVVAVIVGRLTAKATIKAAEITADIGRNQLEHQEKLFSVGRQDLARDDFIRAINLMRQVALKDARLDVRLQRAEEARNALFKVDLILGGATQPAELRNLLHALDEGSEAQLNRALDLWPDVERRFRRRFGI